ncbi:monothiol glutaredoxin-S10-like protein [Cinnamomum micranthum f. kanehirae]|uniref:Monothiol glutaredoxin-S10-like protein n=1 Tax=Cinnamomum micranthum f. kanehirae TaxID=337451 RepID=A0A3S3MHJ4_9MAGN|nr:monothiol glutaredoxin-S10-like protein [Cinnamomum micranthum f. kanehirae]
MDHVQRLASKNAVVIFTKSSCCMCHVVKRLFYDLGVNAAIYELDNGPWEREMEWALSRLLGNPSVPAVFIGGKFVGTTENINTLHIQGTLVPMLKAAGALWL